VGVRTRVLLLAGLLILLVAAPNPSRAAGPWIGVRGNGLVDGTGKPVRLLGVNRSGAEYECVEGSGIFDGPIDWASIKAMKTWHVNAVRLPLNETCWLGINGVPSHLSASAYRAVVREYVELLERAGLYVILELQWAAPGEHWGTGLIPLPDADHSPAFWRSIATEYRDDRSVLFDLFNEPHDVSWHCWAVACQVYDQWFGWYQAASMPELLSAVRSTGARQPVLLGGLDWARDLGEWLLYRPVDPANALVASNHTYDYKPCYRLCRAVLVKIARRFPVVTGELGETDCLRRYVNPYMQWADRNDVSYLGWTWNTGGRWDCSGGPALINDYDGSPTRYGVGLRKHLRRLWLNQGAERRASNSRSG